MSICLYFVEALLNASFVVNSHNYIALYFSSIIFTRMIFLAESSVRSEGCGGSEVALHPSEILAARPRPSRPTVSPSPFSIERCQWSLEKFCRYTPCYVACIEREFLHRQKKTLVRGGEGGRIFCLFFWPGILTKKTTGRGFLFYFSFFSLWRHWSPTVLYTFVSRSWIQKLLFCIFNLRSQVWSRSLQKLCIL